jgi:hypothetical protein
MRIDLTDDEARTLGAMLRDYLPSLRFEVARTDQHDFRHELLKRQDVCERLLESLDAGAALK